MLLQKTLQKPATSTRVERTYVSNKKLENVTSHSAKTDVIFGINKNLRSERIVLITNIPCLISYENLSKHFCRTHNIIARRIVIFSDTGNYLRLQFFSKNSKLDWVLSIMVIGTACCKVLAYSISELRYYLLKSECKTNFWTCWNKLKVALTFCNGDNCGKFLYKLWNKCLK